MFIIWSFINESERQLKHYDNLAAKVLETTPVGEETMYQFPNQPSVHNEYQQYFDVPTPQAPILLKVPNPPQTVSTAETVNGPVKEPPGKKGCVDTSSFTVEERVVAAAWVHERHHTHVSIGQIKQQFEERFGRAAPAKNTLLGWERKLFSSGSVHDAPRTGRPARRKLLASEVSASIRAAPTLSVRARAAALRVPRSTLRVLLRRDLAALPLPAPAHPVKQKARRSRATPSSAPST